MAKPILHGPAYSTYVRTARLAFEEKGGDYDLDHFDFMQGFPEEHRARHPFNRGPGRDGANQARIWIGRIRT